MKKKAKQAMNGKRAKAAVPAQRAITKLDLKKPVKVAASPKPRSKSEIFETIGRHVGIHRRDVAATFHALGGIIKADLSKMGAGVSNVPGLLRITVKRKPATPERGEGSPAKSAQGQVYGRPEQEHYHLIPL